MTRPGETVLEYREPLDDDDQLAGELRERSAEVLCVAAVWGAVLIAVVALLTLAVLTVVFD